MRSGCPFRLSVASLCLGMMIAASPASPIWAEDASQDAVTVRKTKDNLNFNLPPDWPVEKRGGVVGPIPVEEYLAKKFKELDAKLQAIEQRLSGLDIRLRVLEEAASKKTTSQTLTAGSSKP